MSAFLCVGGPMHGQQYEAEDFQDEFVVEVPQEVEVSVEYSLHICRQIRPERHTYRRRGIGPNCIVWLHSSIPVTL